MRFFRVNRNKYGGGSYFRSPIKKVGFLRSSSKTPLGRKYFAVTKKLTFFSWNKKDWFQT